MKLSRNGRFLGVLGGVAEDSGQDAFALRFWYVVTFLICLTLMPVPAGALWVGFYRSSEPKSPYIVDAGWQSDRAKRGRLPASPLG